MGHYPARPGGLIQRKTARDGAAVRLAWNEASAYNSQIIMVFI